MYNRNWQHCLLFFFLYCCFECSCMNEAFWLVNQSAPQRSSLFSSFFINWAVILSTMKDQQVKMMHVQRFKVKPLLIPADTISTCLTVPRLCLRLLEIIAGQTVPEYGISLTVFPFSLLPVGFEVVLDPRLNAARWMGRGGNRGRVCAHHPSLFSYWQESACCSVGERRTCIPSKEKEKREKTVVGW